MAEIVLGIASSHTPQLNTTPDWWHDHAARDRDNEHLLGDDGEFYTYDELLSKQTKDLADQLTEEVWASKHDRAQQAVAVLRERLCSEDIDAVIIFGDDQNEMFIDDGVPAFGIFAGPDVVDKPHKPAKLQSLRDGQRAALWAVHNEVDETYPVSTDLGLHLIEELVASEFDVSYYREQPSGRSIGHAFTFVRRRLMGESALPMVPICVNTYLPPNQPTPSRCFSLGQSVADAVATFPEDIRVAVVASGGLSHFVVDEELDQQVLRALATNDGDLLGRIPRKHLRSGTSEVLNWMAAGGALGKLSMSVVDYIPAYRSPAGTGVGMGFAVWS